MARQFQTLAPQAERQFRYGFGHLQPAHGDHGQPANPGILVVQRTHQRQTAREVDRNEGSQKEGQHADVAIPMLQDLAQVLDWDVAFPGHQDFERRALAPRVARAQRLPDRSRGQCHGVPAQVFGHHNAGQQVGLDGQREELPDLVLASGQQQSPAGRKPHFLIAVLQGFQKQAARHPPAGLVHARVGEAGVCGTAADHVATPALRHHC